jgi:hypothetical protein
MKIIVEGKIPPPVRFKGKCDYCWAVVECEEKECSCEGDRNGHHGEARYYVKCPTKDCPRDIDLKRIYEGDIDT